MNASRFFFGQPAPSDAQIMERATGLKIDLYKDRDDDVHGSYEITGSFGYAREYQSPEDFQREQQEAFAFVAELLARFREKPADGEEARCG